MFQDLSGKVAVVTGSATGLGAAIVKRFVQEEMKVVINYLSEEQKSEVMQVVEKYNQKEKCVIAVQADVTEEQAVELLANKAVADFGTIDVWVNNAGIEIRNETHKVSLEEWRQQLDVNLGGVFLGARQAIRQFLKEDKAGVIINMSSVHEKIPWPTFAAYSASKGGVKLFTETIALEYAGRNIRVNGIAPGAIETPINAEKFADADARGQTEEMIPMDEIGQTEHVAAAAAWLASQESDYVTGTTLFVDGGMKLYPSFEKGDG